MVLFCLNNMTAFESEDGVGGQENGLVPTFPSQLSLTTNLLHKGCAFGHAC